MSPQPDNHIESLQAAMLLALTQSDSGLDLSLLSGLKARDTKLSPGQTLYRQGQKFGSLYLVRDGVMKTHVDSERGREQITSFRRSGELIGLDALNSHRHLSAATAVKATQAEEIRYERLCLEMDQDAGLEPLLRDCLSQALAESEETVVLLGSKDGLSRIATFLLIQSLREGAGQPCLKFTLDMPRTDIGHYLGLSKESACRLLKRLQDAGLLNLANKHVTIRRLDALCHTAGVASLSALTPLAASA